MIFRGMKYVFLLPYFPDYNPIETVFLAFRQYIKQNGDHNLYCHSMSGGASSEVEVYCQLHEAVHLVTPANAVHGFVTVGIYTKLASSTLQHMIGSAFDTLFFCTEIFVCCVCRYISIPCILDVLLICSFDQF